MLLIGFCYALLFCLILALSSLFDGGEFARMYLLGGEINETIATDSRFQDAVMFSLVLYLPLVGFVLACSSADSLAQTTAWQKPVFQHRGLRQQLACFCAVWFDLGFDFCHHQSALERHQHADGRWSTHFDAVIARHVDDVGHVFHILLFQFQRLFYQRTRAGLNLRQLGHRQGQPLHAMPIANFTCARASSPRPSTDTTAPSPNLV